MKNFFTVSFVLHLILLSFMFWSVDLSLLLLEQRRKDLEFKGTIQVSLTYKPTQTEMLKGEDEKDLPPPKITKKNVEEDDSPKLVTKKPVKQKPKADLKKKSKKPDLKSILDKIKAESSDEDRPMPKLDNFPKRKDGRDDSVGTGGNSKLAASPAEQALQNAMRRYFELPQAEIFRRQFPNAKGVMDVKLMGVGNRFEIVSLTHTMPSGFTILDKSCEQAIRKAMVEETFSKDVISELTGRETTILCHP